ncbi:MAG: MaoC family dehydratase [Geminicoccaceae bacterium]
MKAKSSVGRFFEDFELDETIHHATPRTVLESDATLYQALTGSRFAQNCSLPFARENGLDRCPIDDLLAFHIVFGKTVPDISLNAVANLGYAELRFRQPVYPGDTLTSTSKVIGKKEISSGKAGIVYVRTTGSKDDGSTVIDFVRWVMVRKRNVDVRSEIAVVPDTQRCIDAGELTVPPGLGPLSVDTRLSGSPHGFEDYEIGEKIDHLDGMGVMQSEHRLATRLYQNTARVHFNDHVEKDGRLGGVIVYGGVIISLARALSFNGLGNAIHLLAINAGTHANPCTGGDTVYAWSEVLDRAELSENAGALRLRLVALKNRNAAGFPLRDEKGSYLPEVLLDLDYWALMPRRTAFRNTA